MIAATGPIYRQVITGVEVPPAAMLTLLNELAQRAMNPKARVQNPVAKGLRGSDAFLGHAYVQGIVFGHLLRSDSWSISAMAACVVGHCEMTGKLDGLEGLAASLANLMWKRTTVAPFVEMASFAQRLLATSGYTLRFPYQVLESSGACASFDAATYIKWDDDRWKRMISAAEESAANLESASTDTVTTLSEGMLNPSTPAGAVGVRWFGEGLTGWRTDDHTTPPLGPVGFTSTFGPGDMTGDLTDAPVDEPFHLITDRELVSQGKPDPIETVTAKGVKPEKATADAAHAKAQEINLDEIDLDAEAAEQEEAAKQANKQIKSNASLKKIVGMGAGGAGLVVGLFTPTVVTKAIGLAIGAFGLGLNLSAAIDEHNLEYPENPIHLAGTTDKEIPPGGHKNILWYPNPDSEGAYGGSPAPGLHLQPRNPSWVPNRPTPSDRDDTPATAWRRANPTIDGYFTLVDPLWDPIEDDLPIASEPGIPPRYVPTVKDRWVFYTGPGLAAFVSRVAPSKIIASRDLFAFRK